MEHQPKISIPEAMLLMIIAIIADLIGWIPIVNWVVAIFMFPITQLYFRLKGVKGFFSLIGNLAELIPVISALPAYTFSIGATLLIDRSPRLQEKLTKTTGIIKPGVKKV
jgi:hypothetical protein